MKFNLHITRAPIAETVCFIREQQHGNLDLKVLRRNFDKFEPNGTIPVTQTKEMETSYFVCGQVNMAIWRP